MTVVRDAVWLAFRVKKGGLGPRKEAPLEGEETKSPQGLQGRHQLCSQLGFTHARRLSHRAGR